MPHDTAFQHDESGGPRIGDLRALTVEGDLAAIDHLHWTDTCHPGGIDHMEPWWRECEVCGSDVTFYACECTVRTIATPPLRVPFADLARCA